MRRDLRQPTGSNPETNTLKETVFVSLGESDGKQHSPLRTLPTDIHPLGVEEVGIFRNVAQTGERYGDWHKRI